MKKLDVIATVKDGLGIALVNYLSLVICAALYLITIWIPYLNVGTTIAMCSLPAEMAKGHMVRYHPGYRNLGSMVVCNGAVRRQRAERAGGAA